MKLIYEGILKPDVIMYEGRIVPTEAPKFLLYEDMDEELNRLQLKRQKARKCYGRFFYS